MLPNDSIEAATRAASSLMDQRIRHFFDPKKQVGKKIGSSLNWDGQIAWDIYLFYAPGHKWDDLPPPPARYVHQLTNEWADREHYRVAADLTEELKASMETMMQAG